MDRIVLPPGSRTFSRRKLLISSTAVLVGTTPRASFAGIAPTPAQTAGPFYPKTLPLDSDNDLVRIAGHRKEAEGIVTHLVGRILDAEGRAVRQARVEIWQCDSRGRYHYVDDRPSPPADPDFQGYGSTISDDEGGYRFRTIRPVPYPGRTPHIHFAILARGGERLVTQMYVADEPLNAHDPVLTQIRDPRARARIIVALRDAPNIEARALAGQFDIVLGA